MHPLNPRARIGIAVVLGVLAVAGLWRFKTWLAVALVLTALTALAAVSSGLVASAQEDKPQSVPEAPDKPTGAAIWKGMVELDWNDVPGAESYDVQFFSGHEWVDLPSDEDGYEIAFYGSRAIVSNLPHEGTYYFQVRASNALGSSDWSDYLQMPATFTREWDDIPEPTLAPTPTPPAPANTAATGLPTISGAAQVGRTLTASTSGIADADGMNGATFGYQWVSGDGTTDADIQGATAATYTVQPVDEGRAIRVRVTFTDDGGSEETLTSDATSAVEAAATVPGAPRSVTVDQGASRELAVSWEAPSSDGGSPITSYKVQHKEAANSWDVPSEVSETTVDGTSHSIGGLSNGVAYTVRVIASNGVGDGAPSVEAAGTPRETTPPELSSAMANGATLVLTYDEALDEAAEPATTAFAVRAGSAARAVSVVSVSGRAVTLTLASAVTSGDAVSVSYNAPPDPSTPRVQDTSGNGAASFSDEAVANNTPAPVNTAAAGLPTISGAARVGRMLTASTSGVADADGMSDATFSYQWVSGDGTTDADIQGATAATYTVQPVDEGRAIRVRVTFTDDRGSEETLTSDATSAVEAAATVPGAPRSVTVRGGGSGELVVSWEAPSSDGGSAVTGYKIQWKSVEEDYDSSRQAVVTDQASLTIASHRPSYLKSLPFYTISGLTNGTEYSVRMVAYNEVGDGVPSAETTGTPQGLIVAVELSASDSVVVGTEITLTMTFSDLEFDSDTSDVDYIFRADVMNSDGEDADSCEGGGMGRDRNINKVDEEPETRSAAISSACPSGDYTAQVSLSSAAGVELASASAELSIVLPVLGPPEDAPNIVLILVDDLGYNDVSYNGATEIETTNIDRLAEEGIIFSNGYVPYPVCTPSRAGLLTGRYPARFGLEGNIAYMPFDPNLGMPLEETTFPTYLQNAGYRTGIVGKWQLGAAPHFAPPQRGFDYFFGFLGGSHDYWRIDATAPGSQLVVPLIENTSTASFTGYLTDALTDKAIEFMSEEQDDPFFLYLAYNAPHTPLQAPAELVEKYEHIENVQRRTYLAMVDSLDQNVGRVMDALEQSGQRDNTIVFFLSDNGAVLGLGDNGSLRGGKGDFYEGGIRVPFVASWPARWPQGETYEPMVISLDIAATVLEMAGATAADEARPLDGVDLDPFVRGETSEAPHEALFWRGSWRNNKGIDREYAVRSGNTKLVLTYDWGPPILVDLDGDIGETRRDLLADDREGATELAGLWNAWNRDNHNGTLFLGVVYYFQKLNQYMEKYAASRRTIAANTPIRQIVID